MLRQIPVFALLFVSLAGARALAAGDPSPVRPSILVTGFAQNGMNFFIDPVLEEKLNDEGYQVASLDARDLTTSRLKMFNEVVLVEEYATGTWSTGHSSQSQQEAGRRLGQTYDMLLDYVRAGGGLLLFFDEQHYANDWNYDLNQILKPMDASVAREAYGERDPANIHMFTLLADRLCAYRTDAVTPHPVTEGVREVWYPGSNGGSFTGVMKVGTDWQVLVKSSSTSYMAATYPSGFPLLAVRKFGAGKVALLPVHSSFYVNNGFHRAYDSGWMLNHGSGMQLFRNLFNWLGDQPKSLHIGGYVNGQFPSFRPAGYRIEHTPHVAMTAYPGILGVYTNHSGGACTVDQYCAAARKLGLKFVAFTDKITEAGQWNDLKAECARNSDGSFVALPGVEWSDRSGNRGAAFNIDAWPPSEGLDKANFITVLLNSGREYGGIYAILQPHSNPLPPENLGGFNSIEIASPGAEHSRTEDNVGAWQALQAIPGYTLLPVASRRINDVDGLAKAAVTGYKLYLYAPSLDKLRETPSADIVPGFTSSGPVVEEFWTDGLMNDPWEHYVLWKPGQHVNVHIRISGPNPLREIILFSGHSVARRFEPGTKAFSAVITIPMAQDGPLFLTVADEAGGRAYTNAIPTRNEMYWNHVGSDRANNYTNPVLPDRYGTMTLPDGQRLGFGGLVTYGLGWGSYLRFYHPVAGDAFHPQGFETGRIRAGLETLRTYPKLFSPDTNEQDDVLLWRDYELSSQDVAIVSEKGELNLDHGRAQPSKAIHSQAEGIFYRYKFRPFGYIIGRMTTSATVVGDNVNLPRRDGPNLAMLEYSYLGAKDVKHYTYIDPRGQKHTGDIDPHNLSKSLAFHVGKGGYFVLWPDQFGLLFLYVLSDNVVVEVGKTDQLFVRAGFDVEAGALKRGDQYDADFIVVEEGGAQGPQLCDRLANLWGLNSTPSYAPRILSGSLLPEGYIVRIAARVNGARVRFSNKKYDLPNDILPMCIDGVNPNWSAGVLDSEGAFRPAAVAGNSLYLGLDQYAGRELFLGNPIVCNASGIRIEIDRSDKQKIAYTVHNLSDKKAVPTFSPAPASGLSPFEATVALLPGETLQLSHSNTTGRRQ